MNTLVGLAKEENEGNRRKLYLDIQRKYNDLEPYSISEYRNNDTALCCERAAIAQNMLAFLGADSYYIMGHLSINDGAINMHHAYNVIVDREYGSGIIVDFTNPVLRQTLKERYVFQSNIINSDSIQDFLKGKHKEAKKRPEFYTQDNKEYRRTLYCLYSLNELSKEEIHRLQLRQSSIEEVETVPEETKKVENVDKGSLIEQYIKIAEGMSISAKGGNKGCFIIDKYALLKTNGISEREIQQLMRIDKQLKAKGVNIATTLDYKITDQDSSKEYREGYILQEKAIGKPLHERVVTWRMDEKQISEAKSGYIINLQNLSVENQEFYDKFISDWIEILKEGLQVDPSKTDNFYYEKGNQITFIDLNVDDKVTQNIDLNRVCQEILAVLSNSVRYYEFSKDPRIKEEANKLLTHIFEKVARALSREGLSYNEFAEIVHNSFPDIKIDAKDGPNQAIEQEGRTIQEPRKQIENIKTSVEDEKIIESERQKELSELSEMEKQKRLIFELRTKKDKTEEERRLLEKLEENERRINQTQVDYRRSIDSENKESHGLSM